MNELMKQIESITNDFEVGVSSKSETNTAILELFVKTAIDAKRYRLLRSKQEHHLRCDKRELSVSVYRTYGIFSGEELDNAVDEELKTKGWV